MLTRKPFVGILFLIICSFLTGSRTAHAQYLIGHGDEIEISIEGFPDLRRRTIVDIGGRISLPFGGHVEAVGVNLETLRERVQHTLSAQNHRRAASDGQTVPSIFLRDAISLTIVTYRPVYIMGDVDTPGEQPFRPGLTVRNLVALAGGLGSQALRSPSLKIASLQSEYRIAWIDVARQQALIRRLDAELANNSKLNLQGKISAPIDPKVKRKIETLEEIQLVERTAQFAREAGILDAALKRSNSHLELLKKTENNNQKGMKITEEQLDRVQRLFQKGLSPITTLNDARRNSLLQSTRQLQTLSQVALTEKDRDQLLLERERAQGKRLLSLLAERQNAEVELAKAQARLESLRVRLQLLNALPLPPSSGNKDEANVYIYRKTKGVTQRITANHDSDLLPGDTVEVELIQMDYSLSVAEVQYKEDVSSNDRD